MRSAQAPLLQAHGLAVPGSRGRPRLDGVSLGLGRGELVGLVGANGAGKTTLLRVLGGLVQPREGTVLLGGQSLRGLPARARARRVAQVPQSEPLTIDFTGWDLVLMGRYPHLGPLEAEGSADRDAAWAALEETDAADCAQRRLSTVSAGERQRLIFARGRCQQGEVLLCDEPTANLDLRHRLLVFGALRRFVAEGGAVLAAVHDLELAAQHCSRLLLLHEGRLLADGLPAEVLTPEHLATAFDVEARIHRDPVTGALRVSVLRPLGDGTRHGKGWVGEGAGDPVAHARS